MRRPIRRRPRGSPARTVTIRVPGGPDVAKLDTHLAICPDCAVLVAAETAIDTASRRGWVARNRRRLSTPLFGHGFAVSECDGWLADRENHLALAFGGHHVDPGGVLPGRHQDEIGEPTTPPAEAGKALKLNSAAGCSGMGRVTIELANVTIEAADNTASRDAVAGDFVRVTVRDDGSGMDEDTPSHLFEPFFTTKAPGKGTGLGQATVYGIVTQNGGFVTVQSAPARGTTMMIPLPQASRRG